MSERRMILFIFIANNQRLFISIINTLPKLIVDLTVYINKILNVLMSHFPPPFAVST
jgi:hypothetical protein